MLDRSCCLLLGVKLIKVSSNLHFELRLKESALLFCEAGNFGFLFFYSVDEFDVGTFLLILLSGLVLGEFGVPDLLYGRV